jgi:hypothetical protein
MNDDRKTPLWPWIVAVLILAPVLYILSSGPARSIMLRRSVGTYRLHGRTHTVWTIDEGWWGLVYAPLRWAADQELGAPLEWYWELFPISDDP